MTLGAAWSALGEAPAASASPLAALRELNEGLVDVFEKVAPSVVVITVEREADGESQNQSDVPDGFDFFFRNPRQNRSPGSEPIESEGSGFIFRPDGYILTNNHLVEDSKTVKVRLRDGRSVSGRVVGTDDKTDVAVVKIEETGLPAVELGDSDKVRVGQLACAIGTPYNLDYTFTLGVVSAKGRSNLQQAMYEEYIQTDASINPGNSGGPLFDIDGRVIGMNTLINGINRGLGFAIPSNMLSDISGKLIKTGHIQRPWLGIRIEALGDDPRMKGFFQGIDAGVVVSTIPPEAPAFKSDLRPADVITEVDGAPVKTVQDLQKAVLRREIGANLKLRVFRGGKTLDIDVKTGEMPDDVYASALVPPDEPGPSEEPEEGEHGEEASRGEPGGSEMPREHAGSLPAPADPAAATLGVKVQPLTAELRAQLGVEDESGVVVTEAVPGSPAEVAGLLHGDVITEVDSVKLTGAKQFEELIAKADKARGVLLFVNRKGEKTYAVLKPSK